MTSQMTNEAELMRQGILYEAEREGSMEYVSRLLKLAYEAENERRLSGCAGFQDERSDVEIYLNAVRIVIDDMKGR
jgi:hypothetical protein